MAHIYKNILCVLLAGCLFMVAGCSHMDNSQTTLEQTATEAEQNEVDEKTYEILAESSNEEATSNNSNGSTPVQTAQTSVNIKSDSLEEVSADCIFSIGIACRPSGHLRDLNLRFQAAPLDWMTSHSLSAVAHLFETNFEDFFGEITEVPNTSASGHRYVRDTKNDIISMHHFEKGIPLDIAQKQFRETMLNRANNVDKILKDSSSIALLCNRNKSSAEELIEFLNRFSTVYPGKKITLINIKDENVRGIKKDILLETDSLKIIQYTFNDKSSGPDSWKGNIEAWTGIIKSIKLNGKFAKADACENVGF